QLNKEVVFHAKRQQWSDMLRNNIAMVDTTLYSMYDTNDLRKVLFYKMNANQIRGFYGDYSGSTSEPTFTGIATDEIWLSRAEAKIRIGDVAGGMGDLDHFLENRYVTGTYVKTTVTDPKIALKKVLDERRKQLAF